LSDLRSRLQDAISDRYRIERELGHDPVLNYNLVSQPLFEPLRRDPRGTAILQRMALPPGR
jgi:hypothetical protein